MAVRAARAAFVALVVALFAHQAWLWRGGLPVETDLLALVPGQAGGALETAAVERLTSQGGNRLVVLLGASSPALAAAAARAFLGAVSPELAAAPPPSASPGALLDALAPYRSSLAPRGGGGEDDVEQALLALHQPVPGRLLPWLEDPAGLFTAALAEQLDGRRLRPADGLLWTEEGEVAVVLTSRRPAFALDGSRPVGEALARGERAAEAVDPAARVTAAGVPLFAEAAAAGASREVSVVGLGSLVAILVVMALAFASPRPLLWVAVSVALGVAAGISACVLVFEHIHVVTLVFGAGLVGVAEDFGIHAYCARQASPAVPLPALWRGLFPGLALALGTSVAAYAMLAAPPFPGLRQVAVFSIAGLVVAFAAVMLVVPVVDRSPVKSTRLARAWAASRRRWPSLRGGWLVATAGLAVAAAAVASQARPDDDVRALQRLPAELVEAQRTVARAVGLPGPAQLFVVRGGDEAEVLAREEALTARLEALVAAGRLDGYEAVSRWVPSPARQARSRSRWEAARQAVSAAVGDALSAPLPAPPGALLTVEAALGTPLAAAVAPLWLGEVEAEVGSTVLVAGLTPAALAEVAAAADGLDGVSFVDRPRDISSVLRRYRVLLSWLLVPGYLVVGAALALRYRARAWRALAPVALASVVAVAAVVLSGDGFHVFHAFALWLLLGMGTDYGIFLSEHPSRQEGAAWLAVGLGAVSTFLAFGLLATSTTPAISAFGLVMGVGIPTVWALAPVFADRL